MSQSPAATLPPPLVLASASVYRRQMLERLQWSFEAIPADIDETPLENEEGEALARRLAREKAAVIAAFRSDALVLGCDQVAACDGRLLGKPGSAEKALEQLTFTAGKEIVFHSAMALQHGSRRRIECVPTRVRMKSLSSRELTRYIDSDEPFDCAGAMRSESLGITLTEYIRSDDPTALIGLPLIRLTAMLSEFGIDVLQASGSRST